MTGTPTRRHWLRNLSVDSIVTGLVGLLCIAVGFLDFLGTLDQTGPVKERIPAFTLLLLGVVAEYVVIERGKHVQAMHREISAGFEQVLEASAASKAEIIQSLQGVQVMEFSDGNDLIQYLNQRLQTAHRRVDDLTWSSGRSVVVGRTRDQGNEHLEAKRAAATRIEYREVFRIDAERFRRIEQLTNEKLEGYSCAYFPNEIGVPVLQFVIVDEEEVFLMGQPSIVIKSPPVVGAFVGYYGRVWDSATKITEGLKVHEDTIRDLRNKYGGSA